MAFHYFDAPAAIRSIAATLKPGGTLAAVTYGFNLRFPGRPEMEKLWDEAVNKETLRLLRGGCLFPAAVRGMAAAMAGLDFVPLPVELFEPGAIRLLINTNPTEKQPLGFVQEDPSCWEPVPDRIGPTDVCKTVQDDQNDWRRMADMTWLRSFLTSCKMGFGQTTWEMEEWRALEGMVYDEGGEVLVEWPVALILATRNGRSVD